jgi:hypothetical protein
LEDWNSSNDPVVAAFVTFQEEFHKAKAIHDLQNKSSWWYSWWHPNAIPKFKDSVLKVPSHPAQVTHLSMILFKLR